MSVEQVINMGQTFKTVCIRYRLNGEHQNSVHQIQIKYRTSIQQFYKQEKIVKVQKGSTKFNDLNQKNYEIKNTLECN